MYISWSLAGEIEYSRSSKDNLWVAIPEAHHSLIAEKTASEFRMKHFASRIEAHSKAMRHPF
jgi:hypothetical protein